MGLFDGSERRIIADPASAQQAMLNDFYRAVKAYVDDRLNDVVDSEGKQVQPRGITEDDILLRFTHHTPATEQIADIHNAIRVNFKEFARQLLPLPEGREKALAYTALEEASFWAHAAVARHGGKGKQR